MPNPKGRPKGSPNRTTKSAKENIERVFGGLGGHVGMLEWVKADDANRRVFYGQVYPKLLPLQVRGDQDSPLRMVIEWAESNA